MKLNRLAITKRIPELQDKPLIVESKAEIGTTFTILPVYNPVWNRSRLQNLLQKSYFFVMILWIRPVTL